jgi:hypothetical protein
LGQNPVNHGTDPARPALSLGLAQRSGGLATGPSDPASRPSSNTHVATQRPRSKRLWNRVRNELVTERDSPLLDFSPANVGSSSVRDRIARTFSRLRSSVRSPINSGRCPLNFCRKDRALGAPPRHRLRRSTTLCAQPRLGKLPLPPPPQ